MLSCLCMCVRAHVCGWVSTHVFRFSDKIIHLYSVCLFIFIVIFSLLGVCLEGCMGFLNLQHLS